MASGCMLADGMAGCADPGTAQRCIAIKKSYGFMAKGGAAVAAPPLAVWRKAGGVRVPLTLLRPQLLRRMAFLRSMLCAAPCHAQAGHGRRRCLRGFGMLRARRRTAPPSKKLWFHGQGRGGCCCTALGRMAKGRRCTRAAYFIAATPVAQYGFLAVNALRRTLPFASWAWRARVPARVRHVTGSLPHCGWRQTTADFTKIMRPCAHAAPKACRCAARRVFARRACMPQVCCHLPL